MGQAKRRRAELGALYGTCEGSNRPPAVQFREMTADEIEALDPQVLAKLREEWGRPLRCVMACCGGETVPLVAAPVIDEAGQFNSYVAPIPAWGGHQLAALDAVADWLLPYPPGADWCAIVSPHASTVAPVPAWGGHMVPTGIWSCQTP